MTKSHKGFFGASEVSVVALIFILSGGLFLGCPIQNKTITRMQKLEEGVDHPTTIDELKDAINKYEKRVADIQLAQTQTGIWYKMLGTRYLDNKLYGEALKCFQRSLQYFPDNQNLYYYTGLCAGYMSHASLDFEATGNVEKKLNFLKLSESSYLRALEIDDRYSNALYAIGVLYIYELGENEKAIPYLEKLLTIEVRHTDAMFALARAYYSTYDFDKAVSLYDKIITTTKSPEKRETAKANKAKVLEASYDKR